VKGLALIIGALVVSSAASAAGIDSRTYSCADLQTLIAAKGFVFISQATFGDFVVANDSYCQSGGFLQSRSVATRDNPECLVNYCISRSSGSGN